MKQLENKKQKNTEPMPESHLLCSECDGIWVDSGHGICHCGEHTTSSDFLLCLACALTQQRCQHCGNPMHLHITKC